MALKQAKITVRGRVQRGGYRDKVDRIAYGYDITGYVRNLEDGSVEIVCEGEEDTINRFAEEIRIDRYPIKVTDVDVEFSDYKGEFEYFDIIREEDLAKAVYDRMDIAADYLGRIYEETKKVGEKVDVVGEKVDKGFEELGEKVDKNIEETRKVGEKVDAVGEKVESMHLDLAEKLEKNTEETELFRTETREEFASLDSKYHVVSERLLSMDESSKLMEKKLIESVEELKKVVQEFLDSRKEGL